jgi:hypothetical protein
MNFMSPNIQPATEAAGAESVPSPIEGSSVRLNPLQSHFLARLTRLADTKREFDGGEVADPFMKRLLERGIFATYRECVEQGVGAEARHILHM